MSYNFAQVYALLSHQTAARAATMYPCTIDVADGGM